MTCSHLLNKLQECYCVTGELQCRNIHHFFNTSMQLYTSLSDDRITLQ